MLKKIKKEGLRFRRFTRKAYAVFSSIGRCVTIGVLRVRMVAASSVSKLEDFISYSAGLLRMEEEDELDDVMLCLSEMNIMLSDVQDAEQACVVYKNRE